MKVNKIQFSLYIAILLFELFSAYSITPTTPYINNEFSLTKPKEPSSDTYYKIYSFKNQFPIQPGIKYADIVLQFKKGDSSTTRLVFYVSEDKIKQDENKEFIGYDHEFLQIDKDLRIFEKPAIGASEIFVVIFDLEEAYSDSFRIFNENDILPIQNSACILAHRLYDNEKLTFQLQKKADDNFLSVKITSVEKEIPRFAIKENGAQIREYTETNQREEIPISPSEGKVDFVLYVNPGDTVAQNFQMTFCVELFNLQINSISSTPIQKTITYSRPMFFKFDVKGYDINEENAVLFTVDSKVNFDGVYAKLVLPSEKDEELIKMYPREGEIECAFEKDDRYENSYHLYFRFEIKAKDTLLIRVKAKDALLDAVSFTVLVPERIKDITTEQFITDIDTAFPRYYRIDLDKITDNLIVSSSSDIPMSLIYNRLSNYPLVTKPTYRTQFYAISKDEVSLSKSKLIIKLYGKDKSNLEVKYVKNRLFFSGGEKRLPASFNATINNCEQSVYIIGSYTQKSEDYISINTQYGEGSAFYQEYSPLKRIEENLPNETTAKKLTETMKVSGNVDLVKVSCSFHASLLINYSSSQKPPQTIKPGEAYKTEIAQGETLSYDLVPSTQTGFEARIETEAAVVEVHINGVKKAELSKDRKVYRETLTSANNANIPIAFKSITPGIVSFQTGSDSLFQLIKQPITQTKSRNILIELSEQSYSKEEYYSVAIMLSTSQKELIFCYSQSITESSYVPIPKTNCQKINPIASYIKIANPFDKYITSSGKLYVAISFEWIPTTNVEVLVSFDTKSLIFTLKEKVLKLFPGTYPPVPLNKQKTGDNKEFLALTFIPCPNETTDFALLFNKEKYFEEKGITAKKTTLMKDHNEAIDIEFSQGDNLFSYSYVTQKEYDDSMKTVTTNLNLDISSKIHNTISIKYEPFRKGQSIKYDIYAVKSNSKEELVNLCSLYHMDLPPNKTIIVAKENGFIEEELPVTYIGEYKVNVKATLTEGIIIAEAYLPKTVTVKGKDPDPDPKPDPQPKSKLWLWITLGCIGGVALIGGVIYAIVRVLKSKKKEIPPLTEPFGALM